MNLIFYGTLRSKEKVVDMFNVNPTKVIEGHIVGSLFEVSDVTEPNNVFRYPLFHTDGSDAVSAVLMQFDLTEEEFNHLIDKMSEYEGPLYELKAIIFTSNDGVLRSGQVFAWKQTRSLESATISRIQSSNPILWE